MPATITQHGDQIRDYYQKYLGRPAVASEVADWVGTGKSINEIEAGLRGHALANPASVTTTSAPAPTTTQIQDLYQQNFGRGAVDEEVQNWKDTGKSASEVATGIADHWEAERYRQTGTSWPGAASASTGSSDVWEPDNDPEPEQEEPFDYASEINRAVTNAMAPYRDLYNNVFNSSQQRINDATNRAITAEGERDRAVSEAEEAVNRANSYKSNVEDTELFGLRTGATVSGQNTSPYAGIIGGSPTFSSDEDNRSDGFSISAEDSVLANRGPVVQVMDRRSSLTGGDGMRSGESRRMSGLRSGGGGTAAHYRSRFS